MLFGLFMKCANVDILFVIFAAGLQVTLRAFCCAGIPCYFSPEQKPIEKLKLKLYSFAEIYCSARTTDDKRTGRSVYIRRPA